MPDLVANGYYLLGYDWRETAKDWMKKGAATPPVIIKIVDDRGVESLKIVELA